MYTGSCAQKITLKLFLSLTLVYNCTESNMKSHLGKLGQVPITGLQSFVLYVDCAWSFLNRPGGAVVGGLPYASVVVHFAYTFFLQTSCTVASAMVLSRGF